MRKKMSNVIKIVMSLTILLTTLSTATFAAWWGTPGYEWARSKGLTTMANNSALNNKVSHDNFYATVLKYLKYKGIYPGRVVMQNVGEYKSQNKMLEGVVKSVGNYSSKESLTITEYRELATYIEHVKEIIADHADLLNRDDLKELNLYLSLTKFECANKISDRDYRNLVLLNLAPTKTHNVGAVKHKDLVKYGIKPYLADISRKEFLVVMFSLLSDQNVSEDEIINQFSESGVILGYSDSLMLEENLTYAEMFTFFRRFETFDFNPVEVEEGEDGETEDGIIEYK
ncbi:MAG: hypothetical protein IKJ32_05875 [Clostridia bacterium]|nr:hypothetical protein [Clostridia bacterium]